MQKKISAIATGLALISAQAEAACWTPREVAAAQIRTMDTMLMVASLGCRTFDRGVAARYNAFVEQDRVILQEANAVIQRHFAGQFGRVDGNQAYDEYVTGIANRFGGGVPGLDCGDFARIAEDALSTEGSFGSLVAVAQRADIEPVLDDGTCRAQILEL